MTARLTTTCQRRGMKAQSNRLGAYAVVFVLTLAACVVGVTIWRRSKAPAERQQAQLTTPSDELLLTAAEKAQTESQVRAFCGDCHAVPRPDSFPRDAWHDMVRRGYLYYVQSGRSDLSPPPMAAVHAYYRERAPKDLTFPRPEEASAPLRVKFRRQELQYPVATAPPAVASITWASLAPDDGEVLLVSDMRYGTVASVDLGGADPTVKVLAQLDRPCHVEPCDLDRDGRTDLVVADLGCYAPVDHDRGRVVWLRSTESVNSFDPIVIGSDLGRVADSQPTDIDGDGDIDFVVAEFGMQHTGGIHLLRNETGPDGRPRFRREQLDPRPGTIHLPVHDFDRDGRPDFAALVSQEYESVELFLNQADDGFRRRDLWSAEDLTFGSAWIELADLDQDNDMDILVTNGDAFDNMYANPRHGIQWLENRGNLDFAYHRIGDMAGAYGVGAGDVDGDGDIDMVVSAWLPGDVIPASLLEPSLPSIVCLEQTSPGRFAWHTLERGFPWHPSLEVADFDGDGDLDFATGTHITSRDEIPHWLSVWWNDKNQLPE